MSRRTVVLLLAGVLLGALAWWVTSNFGLTRERVHVGYRGEAARNPLYAARLLLERMGTEVSQQPVLTLSTPLPPDATLVLPAVRGELDPPLLRRLLGWVERGNTIILGAEGRGTADSLLEALGVDVEWPDIADSKDHGRGTAPIEDVLLPDGRRMKVAPGSSVVLSADEEDIAWRHTGPYGDRILVLRVGNGRAVVFSTLAPFYNDNLNKHDHAALLWHFVEEAGNRKIVLVRQLESLGLLTWLRQHAAAALWMLAVFVALWLWRVIPRFGPLAPAWRAQRRSLLEHLRAVGRFQSDTQQLPRLLQQVRDDAQAQFRRAAPLAAGLDSTGRLREASRLTGLRPRELLQAFTASAGTRHEFTNAVRTLAAFRRRLAHRDTGNPTT
jgi:hypothetical protein